MEGAPGHPNKQEWAWASVKLLGEVYRGGGDAPGDSGATGEGVGEGAPWDAGEQEQP
jgi:hypothetical protein